MPQSRLFRKEVLNNNRNYLHGDIILLPKLSHTLLTSAIFIWCSVFAFWLVNSSFERKATVLGWIKPTQGIVKIYPQKVGVISQIFIKNGDPISEGQSLFIINNEANLTNGSQVEESLLNEFYAQELLIKAQIERANQIFDMRIANNKHQIASAKKNLTLLQKQIANTEARYDKQQKQVERLFGLNQQGYVSENDLNTADGEKLLLKSEIERLSIDVLNERNQMSQMISNSKLLPVEWSNEIDKLKEKLSYIAQEIVKLESERSYIVKATKPGIATNLQAFEGQHVSLSMPLLTILPKYSDLQAQLLIPVSASGFIEQGQDINIRYDAFPYQKFGTYSGRIIEVSDSVLLPGELVSPVSKITEPVYSVSASITSPYVRAFGKDIALKSGMTFSTDISLESRTFLEWFLAPIYSLRGKL